MKGPGVLEGTEQGLEHRLVLAVDLDRPEPMRLPPHRRIELLGHALPRVLGQGRDHLAPVLLQYLRGGRWDAPEA